MSLFKASADTDVCIFFLCFSVVTLLVISNLSSLGEPTYIMYGISPDEPITFRAYKLNHNVEHLKDHYTWGLRSRTGTLLSFITLFTALIDTP